MSAPFAEDVAEYLKTNPVFFEQYADLPGFDAATPDLVETVLDEAGMLALLAGGDR